jgi:DNA primase
MIDAIYFWTVGKYAVALNGLGNELQFRQLRNMQCRKFILCTDSDDAGMKARARIKKNVRNKLITEYVLPPGRKDANDCTQDELINLKEIF